MMTNHRILLQFCVCFGLQVYVITLFCLHVFTNIYIWMTNQSQHVLLVTMFLWTILGVITRQQIKFQKKKERVHWVMFDVVCDQSFLYFIFFALYLHFYFWHSQIKNKYLFDKGNRQYNFHQAIIKLKQNKNRIKIKGSKSTTNFNQGEQHVYIPNSYTRENTYNMSHHNI